MNKSKELHDKKVNKKHGEKVGGVSIGKKHGEKLIDKGI